MNMLSCWLTCIIYNFPVGKIEEKNSGKECVFVSLALKIPCQIVKNKLLQTAFSAILPTGFIYTLNIIEKVVFYIGTVFLGGLLGLKVLPLI